MKVLVCDLGNVVAFFDHRRACRQLAALEGSHLTADDVFRDVFTGTLECDVDCGRLSAADFVNALRTQLETTAADEVIARAWCDIFSPNHELLDILPRLGTAGTRLVLASNTNVLHYDWIADRFPELLAPFDDAVLSYRLGCRKPERGFFEACVRTAAVAADHCVYVDDRQDFVDVARSMGMTGIVYSRGTLRAELDRCGLQSTEG
jgi:FMN phosphatase YigB (HAD superfamily)